MEQLKLSRSTIRIGDKGDILYFEKSKFNSLNTKWISMKDPRYTPGWGTDVIYLNIDGIVEAYVQYKDYRSIWLWIGDITSRTYLLDEITLSRECCLKPIMKGLVNRGIKDYRAKNREYKASNGVDNPVYKEYIKYLLNILWVFK